MQTNFICYDERPSALPNAVQDQTSLPHRYQALHESPPSAQQGVFRLLQTIAKLPHLSYRHHRADDAALPDRRSAHRYFFRYLFILKSYLHL